jgi:hypothetical protein
LTRAPDAWNTTRGSQAPCLAAGLNLPRIVRAFVEFVKAGSAPGVSPVPVQMWVGGSPVPVQMWQRRAQSRCRCGRGEPSPGADAAVLLAVPIAATAYSSVVQAPPVVPHQTCRPEMRTNAYPYSLNAYTDSLNTYPSENPYPDNLNTYSHSSNAYVCEARACRSMPDIPASCAWDALA